MTLTYGIGPTGLLTKPLEIIDSDIDTGLQGILGESAGSEPDGTIPLESMAGQLKVLLVDGFSAQWDLLEAIHAELDEGKADGVFLDALGSLTGSTREAQRKSVATGVCIGTPNTSLPVGRVTLVDGTASRFDSATGTVLATGTAFVGSGIYNSGDIRYTPALRSYLCLTASAIASPSGPSGIGLSITDNLVTWKYIGDGIGLAHMPFIAEQYGAIGVATGSLDQISTPVSGWNTVINLLAGNAGAVQETDASFRTRRRQELAAAGNTTPDAIRANILAVNAGSQDPSHQPPTACSVFYNNTDVTDSNNVPPHSVEILVQDGTTGDIAQAIWDSVGAGTRTYGSRSDTVLDSQGNTQVVNWTRPTQVQIWVYGTGRYDASQWPPSSDTLVAQTMLSALLTATADYPIARDVRTSPLIGAFMRGPAGTTGGLAIVPADPASMAVPGLLEVDPLYISTATGVTGTAQIVISSRSIAVFDSTRCFITASSEDP